MSNGWIKLYRKIEDCWIWSDKEPFDKRSAWIDLLLSANHSDQKSLFNGELIAIKRGQILTSIRMLSDKWRWSINRVYRFLKLLENDEMLKREIDNNRTLLTIVNYSIYQFHEYANEHTNGNTDENTDVNTSETPTETLTEHKQECKEYKNDKNINNINNNLSFSNENDCQTETVRRVVACWNDLKDYGIKPVSKISRTSKRYQSLCGRIQQYGIEDVIKAIEKIKNSDFLQGKNKQGWMITFDWFVLPNNFPKVLEGQYDNISPKNDNPKKLERWNI